MLQERMELFTRLERREAPDGLGGQRVRWEEGETLMLAVVPRRPGLGREADAPAGRSRLTLVAPGNDRLALGQRLRRERTGEVLRVLGDPLAYHTPEGALCAYGETEAEVLGE